LYDLPIVTHFEKDAGPFITSSIVFSENQENGKQNQSTHKLLRLDDH
jgi:2,5-furandicarboxylate decarboxylase 1